MFEIITVIFPAVVDIAASLPRLEQTLSGIAADHTQAIDEAFLEATASKDSL